MASNNIPRHNAIQGPPSRSQAIELVSGHASAARDGFDNDVTNCILTTVSGHESIIEGVDEPAPEVGGSGSGPIRKKS